MAVAGIDHWVMVVADVERTLAFYQRLGLGVAWEKRPGRPDMPTLRIGAAQKINIHARDWPDKAGYLGARRPRSAARTSASNGTAPSRRSWRC
ncbi:MAG: VOC family protein [Candidatus Rokubacteria bacterium]|nr:VOC family protein [Candidatus Rokubacteria bacterium]